MALVLVSFDLDGTLIDTAAELAEAVNRTLADFGLPTQPAERITGLIGRGAHALMRAVLDGLGAEGRPAEAAVLARFDTHCAQVCGSLSQPYAGARQALLRLRQHAVRLACVTNKERVHARRLLQSHDLLHHFELVIGGDSLPQQKPHASVLQHVAGTLGVARGAMAHVGDSAIDIAAARQAGVRAWAVPHGYNAGRPIADEHPDLLLPDLAAVAQAALDAASLPPSHIPCPTRFA